MVVYLNSNHTHDMLHTTTLLLPLLHNPNSCYGFTSRHVHTRHLDFDQSYKSPGFKWKAGEDLHPNPVIKSGWAMRTNNASTYGSPKRIGLSWCDKITSTHTHIHTHICLLPFDLDSHDLMLSYRRTNLDWKGKASGYSKWTYARKPQCHESVWKDLEIKRWLYVHIYVSWNILGSIFRKQSFLKLYI